MEQQMKTLMIQQGFLVDLDELRPLLHHYIEDIDDPMDTALRLKPYLTHVNAASLTRLYHALMRSPTTPLSAKLWNDLLIDCQRNERVYEVVRMLVRPYTP